MGSGDLGSLRASIGDIRYVPTAGQTYGRTQAAATKRPSPKGMSRRVRAGNTCLWKRDFGPEASLCAVRVDPSDARRLCLCGQKGSLIVLRLTNMARDRVEQQTYKVDMSASKPGDALRAVFSTTRDLLYVLLPREASPEPFHRANSQGTSLCTL